MELLEVLCPAHTDCRLPAVCVAPCNPESVLDPYASGVVTVLPGVSFSSFGVVVYPFNLFFVEVPVYAVLREACVDSHVSFLVVNTENTCELALFALERNNCAVEDRVAGRKKVTGDYGVVVCTPDNVLTACGSVLPGNVR